MRKISKEQLEANIQKILFLPDTTSFKDMLLAIGKNPETDVIGNNLTGCDFSHQDVSGINFTKANCTNVNWDGANIQNCIFTDTILDPGAFDNAINRDQAIF